MNLENVTSRLRSKRTSEGDVAETMELIRAAGEERDEIDKEVALNREFLRGNHWTTYDKARRSATTFTYEGSGSSWHARPVFNHFAKIRNIRLAKYMEVPTRWSVVPSTTKTRDVDAARAAQRYLDAWVYSRQFNEVRDLALEYATVDGSCWLMFHVHGGVDQVSVVPYHQVFVQPGVTNPQRADWIIMVQRMTVKEAQRYAKNLKARPGKIKPTDKTEFEHLRLPFVPSSYGQDTENRMENKLDADEHGHVILIERHDADGTVSIMTPDQMLFRYKNSEFYPDFTSSLFGGQRFRFHLLKEQSIPGELYGRAVVSHTRSINKYFNRQMGLRMDRELRYAHPPLLVPEGFVRSRGDFSGKPGATIWCSPDVAGAWAQFLQMPPDTGHDVQYARDALEQMQAVTMTPEALMGQLPGGGGREISGRLAAVLLNEASAAISVQIAGMKRVYSRIGYMVLSYAKWLGDMTGQPIAFNTLGKSKAWETLAFQTTDLEPGFSVICEFGSLVESNRPLMAESVREMYREGLIVKQGTREPDPERALELMSSALPVLEPYGQESADRARYEFMAMQQMGAEYIPAMQHEDHEVHLKTHQKITRSQDFYDLQYTNPQAFQMLFQHTMEHEQFLQQQQAQQLMQSHQQIAAGAPKQGAQQAPSPAAPSGGQAGMGGTSLGGPVGDLQTNVSERAQPVLQNAQTRMTQALGNTRP